MNPYGVIKNVYFHTIGIRIYFPATKIAINWWHLKHMKTCGLPGLYIFFSEKTIQPFMLKVEPVDTYLNVFQCVFITVYSPLADHQTDKTNMMILEF